MRTRETADVLGIAGSAICLAHCLAAPLLLVLGPLAPSILQDDQLFHQSMLYVVVPVSAVALFVGCRLHRDRATLVLGVVGLVTLFLAATSLHGTLGGQGEKLFTVAGSLLLAVAHFRNFRLCRADSCDHATADAP